MSSSLASLSLSKGTLLNRKERRQCEHESEMRVMDITPVTLSGPQHLLCAACSDGSVRQALYCLVTSASRLYLFLEKRHIYFLIYKKAVLTQNKILSRATIVVE